jgi:integrase
MEFNKATVAALTMPAGKKEHFTWDPDLPGFGVRLQGDAKRWVIQYRVHGRQHRETLGDVRKVALESARKIARQRFAAVELGRDPAAEKAKAEAAAKNTLGHVAGLYLAAKEDVLRPGTYKASKLHLLSHWKPLHRRPLGEITRAEVAARLQEIITERGRIAAARARATLSALFHWAAREGLVETNPVGMTNDPGAGAKERERALDDRELALLWNVCGDDDLGRITKLLILTGCRREEIGDLSRNEVDLETGVMTIPGKRIKNHRTLKLTLAPAALDILRLIPPQPGRDFFFGANGHGFSCWSATKAVLDQAIADAAGAPLAPWRRHDLRRTMRTGLGRLSVEPHIAELAINHVKGNRYDRHRYQNEIADALARWAEHVLDVAGGRKAAPLYA